MKEMETVPKYISVAAVIESQIQTGKWDGGRMPSVRGVASQYNVSAVTASRALQVLRDKGLIRTVERSGCYRVPPADADCFAVVIRTQSGAPKNYGQELVKNGFDALARREPLRWEFPLADEGKPMMAAEVDVLVKQILATGAKGLILQPCVSCDKRGEMDRLILAQCQAAGLAVVLMGSDIRGFQGPRTHDLVCLDHTEAAQTITETFIKAGKKQIAVVVASPVTSHTDLTAGYLQALYKARQKRTDYPETIINQPGEEPTEESNAEVMEQILKGKVDAVICYSNATANGLILEAKKHRLKIPQSLAVVGFEDGTLAADPALPVSYVEYPAEAITEHAVQLLRLREKNPGRAPVVIKVPSRFIPKATS